MSIIVSSPTTAPMLRMAPIMITARSPISTRSRRMAPGSMRALTALTSRSGTALLRRSHSTTTSSMAAAFCSSAARTSPHSPKTTLSPAPNTRQPGNATSPAALTYAFTGVVFLASWIKRMISSAFIGFSPPSNVV